MENKTQLTDENANNDKAIVSGSACVHCGSLNTVAHEELEYNDGTDEPSTSNHLITVRYLNCLACGE